MNEKVWGVITGAAIAATGAALAYLLEWVSGQDLGRYGPVAAAVLATVANVLRKTLQTGELTLPDNDDTRQ